jgi:hypothetical protein
MTHACCPTIQEAEEGGPLEPRHSELAWATWQDPVSKKKKSSTIFLMEIKLLV